MEDEAIIQRLLISAALDALPQVAREAAMENAEFRRRHDLQVTVGVKLGADGPSFDREHLYDALRTAISHANREAEVQDDENQTWTARVTLPANETPIYMLERGDRHFRIEDHSALALDDSIRIAWLNRTVTLALPPLGWSRERGEELAASALTEDAYAELMEDLEAMPARLDAALRVELRNGHAATRLLVPTSLRYYQRLVGSPTSNMTSAYYLDNVIKPLVEHLIHQYGVRGLRYAILCCTHSRISSFLPLNVIEKGDLLHFYEWLAAEGDPISRIGGVEAALKYLDIIPELDNYIERIIEALVKDDDGDASPYVTLGALINLAGSELARSSILSGFPPFYRRQAAIAQASLVMRALAGTLRETTGFMQWVDDVGYSQVAYFQSLIDLRQEPRFLPDYLQPVQLRAEVVGRLRIAGVAYESKIKSNSLRDQIVGPQCNLASSTPWPRAFLPGPLEGSTEAIIPLPDSFRLRAQDALKNPHLDARSFAAAIEVGYISGDAGEIAALASGALERVNYLVNTDDDQTDTFTTIIGLAIVAGTARSHDLANAVRILAHIKRRRGDFRDYPENELRIALTAAAAFEDVNDWAKFVGEWVTNISFAIEKQDAAGQLLAIVRRLRELELALLPHVARAEAALSAVQRQ